MSISVRRWLHWRTNQSNFDQREDGVDLDIEQLLACSDIGHQRLDYLLNYDADFVREFLVIDERHFNKFNLLGLLFVTFLLFLLQKLLLILHLRSLEDPSLEASIAV